jgi:hypothetical protein
LEAADQEQDMEENDMGARGAWHADGFAAEASPHGIELHRVPGVDHEVADHAERVLRKGSWSTLFAYLFRRFGPPNSGSDDDREIARWVITTPMDGVHLSLFAKPGPLRLIFHVDATRQVLDGHAARAGERRVATMGRMREWSIATFGETVPGYDVDLRKLWTDDPAEYDDVVKRQQEREGRYHREHPDERADDVRARDADLVPIVTAARRAVQDLLRAVPVRDQDISALGEVDGSRFPSADRCDHAGRWLPSYAYGDAMGEVLEAVERLGGDDEGMARVASVVRREIPEDGQGVHARARAILARLVEVAPADGNGLPHPAEFWALVVAARRLLDETVA